MLFTIKHWALHRHNIRDIGAALENLDMALDFNPGDKDALHMKVLLTQILRQFGYMKE